MKTMESLQNGVGTHSGVTPLLFNQSNIASVITVSTLTVSVSRLLGLFTSNERHTDIQTVIIYVA